MKKLALIAMIAGSFIIASCGGGKEENNDNNNDSTQVVDEVTAEDVCVNENAMTVTVKDHELNDNTDFVFETANFEVKMDDYKYVNDSTAEFTLSNYSTEELVGDRLPEQVDIFVELHAKNGKTLEPAIYPYQEWENDYWSKVNIITSEGTVWFNWVMGMPEQGDVVIDFIDEKNICGSFKLNVEKPENASIGIVRLNGTFNIAK